MVTCRHACVRCVCERVRGKHVFRIVFGGVTVYLWLARFKLLAAIAHLSLVLFEAPGHGFPNGEASGASCAHQIQAVLYPNSRGARPFRRELPHALVEVPDAGVGRGVEERR